MTADRKSKAFRTALGGLAVGLGLVGLAAPSHADNWKKHRYYRGAPGVVVVPAGPAYYAPAPVVVAAPVVYPAPVMYAPAYPAYPAYPGNLSIGLNVPLR